MHCEPSVDIQNLSGDGSIALVGHPNVGKSALFHQLTGQRVIVSNYPGTTVEVTRGSARAFPGVPLVDTPGVITLPACSEDEKVTERVLAARAAPGHLAGRRRQEPAPHPAAHLPAGRDGRSPGAGSQYDRRGPTARHPARPCRSRRLPRYPGRADGSHPPPGCGRIDPGAPARPYPPASDQLPARDRGGYDSLLGCPVRLAGPAPAGQPALAGFALAGRRSGDQRVAGRASGA